MIKSTYMYDSEGNETIVAMIDGEVYVATREHPLWDSLKAHYAGGDLEASHFDVGSVLIEYLDLSDTAYIQDDQLYFDGEEMHGTLANKIIKAVQSGEPSAPLVRFMEMLASNPSRNSRDQLWPWLERSGFELSNDGMIVGYKSVYKVSEGTYRSVSQGEASVNDVVQSGHIVQAVHDAVTMPRTEVTDNPAEGCSYGLHVGTIEYATNFSGDVILTVHVNPADVVSVPHDSENQKMRVCRYTIVDADDLQPALGKDVDYQFVNSSWIDGLHYFAEDQVLSVTLKDSRTYNYDSVSRDKVEEFIDVDVDGTSSAGVYFNANIINKSIGSLTEF